MSSSSSLSCQDSRAPATQASDSVAALVERDAGTRGGRMLEVSDDVSMGVRSHTGRDALSMQLAKQAVHAAVGPRQACCGARRMEHRATRVDGRKGVAVQLLGVRAVPEGGSLSCGHVVWGAWQGACADHNDPRSWPALGQRRTRSRQPLRKGDLRTDHGRSASQDGQDACSAAAPRLLAATPPAALAQSWPMPVRDRGVARGRWGTSWTQRRTRARMDHCVWSTRKRVSGANTLG